MNRTTVRLLVVTGCLLAAIPLMGAAVSAQTANDTTNTTDDSETNSTIEFDYDAELANDTVTVSVTANNSAVENASVAVNDTAVGETDTNGTVDFALGNRSAVELGVTVEDTTQTRSYAVEDGTLVEQSEEAELPEAAPEKVSTIQRLIDAFRSGEFDKLGPAISDAVSNDGNADRADNASEQADEPGPPADAGNAPDDAGPPEDVGNAPDDAGPPENPGNAPDDAGNADRENAGNGSAAAGSSDHSDGDAGDVDAGDNADETDDADNSDDSNNEDSSDDTDDSDDGDDNEGTPNSRSNGNGNGNGPR